MVWTRNVSSLEKSGAFHSYFSERDWWTEVLVVCMEEGLRNSTYNSVRSLVSARSWWLCATGHVSQRAWGLEPSREPGGRGCPGSGPGHLLRCCLRLLLRARSSGHKSQQGKLHVGIRKKLMKVVHDWNGNAEKWWDCCPWGLLKYFYKRPQATWVNVALLWGVRSTSSMLYSLP